jgi:hypothetical protein
MERRRMMESNSLQPVEKTCVIWSARQQKELALRVFYELREQDGCKIYTLRSIEPSE